MGKKNKYKNLIGLSLQERVLRQVESTKQQATSSLKSEIKKAQSPVLLRTVEKSRKQSRRAITSGDGGDNNFERPKQKRKKASVPRELDDVDSSGRSEVKKMADGFRSKRKRGNVATDYSNPIAASSVVLPAEHDLASCATIESVEKADLKSKMMEKLSGARFRYISEMLYTKTGEEAKEMFASDRQLFDVYHEGYQHQKRKWPHDPIKNLIRQIKRMPAKFVIADMGCGDAHLATSVDQLVHSFDLVAVNERVTVADISNVPLPDGSVDVCVFCLSLMGTNLVDYICEANRILKADGIMKVVEIRSRFESIGQFKRAVERLGFQLWKEVKLPDDYFLQLDFKKVAASRKRETKGLSLKPCLYKKR